MNKREFVVMVDIDRTLYSFIRNSSTDTYLPRKEIINFITFMKIAGAKNYAWSGGGSSYAKNMIKQLKIDSNLFDGYFSKLDHIPFEIDLTIDDEDYNAKGKLNLKIVQKS